MPSYVRAGIRKCARIRALSVLPDDPMMRRTIGKQYGVNGKETSALENCNDSALENRKILIQKIEEGLVKQCKRVESWFA